MTRSDADLRRWAHEHLVYEVAMLSHAVDKFANKQLSDQDHNAFLESFAIHVRCLRDFLWGLRKKNNPQDAFAFDFCDLGVWEQARPPLPDALRAIETDRRRIGREIVHLTYHRLDIEAETKDWDLTALMAAIAKGLHKFAEVAKEERLHPTTLRSACTDAEGLPRSRHAQRGPRRADPRRGVYPGHRRHNRVSGVHC